MVEQVNVAEMRPYSSQSAVQHKKKFQANFIFRFTNVK